jgi:1-deoxy-D-xylulose-5-phosphate synthase
VIDPVTGMATKVAAPSWTSTFAETLVAHGAKRRDVVAITAAMPGPTGLSKFGERFGDRLFDVGIAEQHALTSAAGLAMGGMHPVVAIYSTFLNRAFDQIMMDVALHKLPVTMVLDRAGITGNDGASHNGTWDLAMLGIVPGIRVAAPRDAARLREELGEALDIDDGPTVLRFPKGDVGEDIPALRRTGVVDVLAEPAGGLSDEVLLVSVGAFAAMALAVAERLRNQGIGVTVVDPRWVLPVPDAVRDLAGRHKLVVTLEDHAVAGGIGSAVSAALRRAEIDVPCRDVGVPQRFLAHASRTEVLADVGLTDQDVARQITGWVAALGSTDNGAVLMPCVMMFGFPPAARSSPPTSTGPMRREAMRPAWSWPTASRRRGTTGCPGTRRHSAMRGSSSSCSTTAISARPPASRVNCSTSPASTTTTAPSSGGRAASTGSTPNASSCGVRRSAAGMSSRLRPPIRVSRR